MNSASRSLQELFDRNRERLQLQWQAGLGGGQRPLAFDAPGSSDLVGYLNIIHPQRIQVLGQQEVDYLSHLDEQRLQHQIKRMLQGKPPAVILSEQLPVPPMIFAQCDAEQVPLWTSPLPAAQIIDLLRVSINKWLAPTCSMHGVYMDVLGMGVLICGESGLGKSELGLELISRGHGLVADDVVEFSRVAPNLIEGRCPEMIQNLLEVRGLGLLDIRAIFGETAVRRKMRLKLIVHLMRRASLELKAQRLVTERQYQDVLGVPIRKVTLPVAAGRNLAVLMEAAVRSTILELRGIDTLGDFMNRQQQAMQSGSADL